jgi:GntR family transcriptional regulator
MPAQRPRSQARQLADDLRDAIVRGTYPPGSTFPSTPTLAADHNLSLHTVNRALQILRGEGLVRVQRGKGTIVRDVPTLTRHTTNRYAQAERERGDARGAFDAEIRAMGFEPRSELVQVGRIKPPQEVADALGLGGKEALIRKRHMYAGETPVQFATSYIPYSIARGTQIEQRDTGPGGTYSRLTEAGHGPVRFQDTISLRLPSAEEAEFLRVSPEQHVLTVFHVAFAEGDLPVEVTTHVHPPHQWRLVYDWPAEPNGPGLT